MPEHPKVILYRSYDSNDEGLVKQEHQIRRRSDDKQANET